MASTIFAEEFCLLRERQSTKEPLEDGMTFKSCVWVETLISPAHGQRSQAQGVTGGLWAGQGAGLQVGPLQLSSPVTPWVKGGSEPTPRPGGAAVASTPQVTQHHFCLQSAPHLQSPKTSSSGWECLQETHSCAWWVAWAALDTARGLHHSCPGASFLLVEFLPPTASWQTRTPSTSHQADTAQLSLHPATTALH